MQAAMIAEKPRKQAISGRFWAGRTYRGRIKDDHKIDCAVPWCKKLIKMLQTETPLAAVFCVEGNSLHFKDCITEEYIHDSHRQPAQILIKV